MFARGHAYQADPQAYVQRGRAARNDRRVGLRPAPDTMSILSGFLPVEQGVACLAALRKHTDTLKNTGDLRTRGQIMADTLVERITGQATATDVHAEVAIVIPVDALTNATPEEGQVAEVVGHGPIPAALAKDILAGSRGHRWWRRLFTAPHGGIVGGDPARRLFDGTLAALINYRDGQRCRDPTATPPPGTSTTSTPTAPAGPPPSPTAEPSASAPTRSGNARLDHPTRPRRPRRPAPHRDHDHPDRARLHQPRRPRALNVQAAVPVGPRSPSRNSPFSTRRSETSVTSTVSPSS